MPVELGIIRRPLKFSVVQLPAALTLLLEALPVGTERVVLPRLATDVKIIKDEPVAKIARDGLQEARQRASVERHAGVMVDVSCFSIGSG